MDILQSIEDVVLEYLDTLPIETQKGIQFEQDIPNTFTYDAEQEMKDALWDLVSSNLNYSSILERLKEKVEESEEVESTDIDSESESD